MRKHLIYMVVLLAVLLAGCGTNSAEQTAGSTTEAATAPAAAPVTLPVETEAAVEFIPEPEPQFTKETEVPTEEPPVVETSAELPYLQTLERGGVSIFDGPGYDFGCVNIIRNKGIYTIVEEAVDDSGNLWGKLKSGAGWINLTELRSEAFQNALISANYADDSLVQSGVYHYYSTKREYALPIAIYAYGTIRNVTIYDMLYNAEGPYPGEELFTLPELTEAMPLVAQLDFPGDMSMYGIRFQDEAGETHAYIIYMSARNGSLVLEKE